MLILFCLYRSSTLLPVRFPWWSQWIWANVKWSSKPHCDQKSHQAEWGIWEEAQVSWTLGEWMMRLYGKLFCTLRAGTFSPPGLPPFGELRTQGALRRTKHFTVDCNCKIKQERWPVWMELNLIQGCKTEISNTININAVAPSNYS